MKTNKLQFIKGGISLIVIIAVMAWGIHACNKTYHTDDELAAVELLDRYGLEYDEVTPGMTQEEIAKASRLFVQTFPEIPVEDFINSCPAEGVGYGRTRHEELPLAKHVTAQRSGSALTTRFKQGNGPWKISSNMQVLLYGMGHYGQYIGAESSVDYFPYGASAGYYTFNDLMLTMAAYNGQAAITAHDIDPGLISWPEEYFSPCDYQVTYPDTITIEGVSYAPPFEALFTHCTPEDEQPDSSGNYGPPFASFWLEGEVLPGGGKIFFWGQ